MMKFTLLILFIITFIFIVKSQPMDEGQRKYMDMKKQSMEIVEKSYNFLRNNLRKQSVYSYDSGLQYKIIKRGSGRFHPSITSTVTIEYVGKLMDGTEFDSSFKRAPVFTTKVQADNVPKGWTEALQHMREGDQWALFVPANLAYEKGIPDKVKVGECVIFTMHLVKIESDPLPVADCNPYSDKFENCAKKDIKFIKTVLHFLIFIINLLVN